VPAALQLEAERDDRVKIAKGAEGGEEDAHVRVSIRDRAHARRRAIAGGAALS
jgi:hypothetical protein